MTLDQSLANLQNQADRLAFLFASTANAIEAGRANPAAEAAVLASPHVSNAIRETFAGTAETVQTNWQPTSPEKMEELRQARDQAVASIAAEAQVPEVVYDPNTGEHKHWAMAQPENTPQTPQGAAPSSDSPTAVPAAAAVEVESQGAATPQAPHPAGPAPWDQQAAEAAAAQAAPAPEKKKGRRTNEDIAAELGVNLDDVKKWAGDGVRISKKVIEDFVAKNPGAVGDNRVAAGPLPTQAANPFGNQGTPPPGPAPVQNNTGAPEPVVAAAPPAPQYAAPTNPAPQGPPQEWPVAQPVPAAPEGQYGTWPTVETETAPAPDAGVVDPNYRPW